MPCRWRIGVCLCDGVFPVWLTRSQRTRSPTPSRVTTRLCASGTSTTVATSSSTCSRGTARGASASCPYRRAVRSLARCPSSGSMPSLVSRVPQTPSRSFFTTATRLHRANVSHSTGTSSRSLPTMECSTPAGPLRTMHRCMPGSWSLQRPLRASRTRTHSPRSPGR